MPEIPSTVNRVKHAIDYKLLYSKPRPYLGMSGVGASCRRKLWYNFRWASGDGEITPETQRIFERGDWEEMRVLRDLRNIGVEVYMMKDGAKVYPEGIREEYQEEVKHFTGHSLGHIDGRVINVPGAELTEHLLEIKTMKAEKFKDYIKNGFLNFPEYEMQIQLYMGYLGLKRCLYIVCNKNTEERSYERYKFDEGIFEEGKNKILTIISTDDPLDLPRISDKPDYYLCSFCQHRQLCFGYRGPEKNCRTCVNVELHDDGIWKCSEDKTATAIPVKIQRTGCASQYDSII